MKRNAPHTRYGEHAEDILNFVLAALDNGEQVAIGIIISNSGGGVRDIGAMMAATDKGPMTGYLSGGCIDADAILQCQKALKTGTSHIVHYGANSGFEDTKLPCGGMIEVMFLPVTPELPIKACLQSLEKRQAVQLHMTRNGRMALTAQRHEGVISVTYHPKLHLRIAGKSADPVALARIAIATGMTVSFWSPDDYCLEEVKRLGELVTEKLIIPEKLPTHNDDAYTAFILMFHDLEWETALLLDAMKGPAFYIGAVGSFRAQETRRKALLELGLSDAEMARIRGPIGLVPQMRDASFLAISALAEVIEADRERLGRR